MELHAVKSLRGELAVPGDKSISHRGVMLGALAEGVTEITNFLQGADCLSTISCFQKMGIEIKTDNHRGTVLIHGQGLRGLRPPTETLDVGNSGTTMRILSGILCGQQFPSTLDGDASIRRRPMKRIIDPLSQMGAQIRSLSDNGCAPLAISPGSLSGIRYESPVASAQVKSAILMAGLYADAPTTVTEPYCSRNHTELMLENFGAQVDTAGTSATIQPNPILKGQKLSIPGDISSAAYFIAAGLITPGSELYIKNVGINPTRDGLLRVCQDMGADITLEHTRMLQGEPVADILVKTSNLQGIDISGSLIPTLIDEIPVIAVMACFAQGVTRIRDAAELKVKESNRIDIMVNQLRAMGADIEGTEDGMIIRGGRPLHGTAIDSHHDHRVAMSFAIAALNAAGTTDIGGSDCVAISYPEFFSHLRRLAG